MFDRFLNTTVIKLLENVSNFDITNKGTQSSTVEVTFYCELNSNKSHESFLVFQLTYYHGQLQRHIKKHLKIDGFILNILHKSTSDISQVLQTL